MPYRSIKINSQERGKSMRLLPTCALLLSLSAIPGLCQNSTATNATTSTALPATANDPSVDYAALRERLAQQNKTLQDQVTTQRAIVKKNEALLKDAQKLDASNKRLEAEKKKLEAENVDLEKQRQALKASQKQVESASLTN
jgi:flagellar motility protein MotE (MotC chaperone)